MVLGQPISWRRVDLFSSSCQPIVDKSAIPKACIDQQTLLLANAAGHVVYSNIWNFRVDFYLVSILRLYTFIDLIWDISLQYKTHNLCTRADNTNKQE